MRNSLRKHPGAVTLYEDADINFYQQWSCPGLCDDSFSLSGFCQTARNFIVSKGQRTFVLVSASASSGDFHHASNKDVLPRKEEPSETKRPYQSSFLSSASFLVSRKTLFRAYRSKALSLCFRGRSKSDGQTDSFWDLCKCHTSSASKVRSSLFTGHHPEARAALPCASPPVRLQTRRSLPSTNQTDSAHHCQSSPIERPCEV
jgi:hypothetical protein